MCRLTDRVPVGVSVSVSDVAAYVVADRCTVVLADVVAHVDAHCVAHHVTADLLSHCVTYVVSVVGPHSIAELIADVITDRLADCAVTVSRLAHGVPMGGELEYLDDGTLAAALKARQTF